MPFQRARPYRSAIRVHLSLLAALPIAFHAAPAAAETVEIVGFGDSLMAGYELGPGEGFPEVLERELTELGYDISVLNAGVSGDTTTGGLQRMEWSVPESADIVIVELGGNDALRGIDPSLTRSNVDAMIELVIARDQRPILAGILAPPNLGAEYEAAFNPIFPEVAERFGVPFYPFFLDGAIQSGLMLDDGIHPSAEGVEMMVERFLPTILPVLDELTAADAAPEGLPPVDPAVPAATAEEVPPVPEMPAPVVTQ